MTRYIIKNTPMFSSSSSSTKSFQQSCNSLNLSGCSVATVAMAVLSGCALCLYLGVMNTLCLVLLVQIVIRFCDKQEVKEIYYCSSPLKVIGGQSANFVLKKVSLGTCDLTHHEIIIQTSKGKFKLYSYGNDGLQTKTANSIQEILNRRLNNQILRVKSVKGITVSQFQDKIDSINTSHYDYSVTSYNCQHVALSIWGMIKSKSD